MDTQLRRVVKMVAFLGRNDPAVSIVALAAGLKCERDALIAPLADLTRLGIIAAWVDPRGATRLSLLRRPREKRATKGSSDSFNLDSLEDRRALEPHEIASARETIERTAPAASDRKPVETSLPRPAVFLVGCQAWPPKRFPFAPWKCQVCRDAPMRRSTYCGACDRSGFDGQIPKTVQRRKSG